MRVVLFAAIFAAALAVDICLPDEFTTLEATELPDRDDVIVSKVWFSVRAQKSRFDADAIIHDGRISNKRFSFVFDYPRSTFYEIAYTGHVANCTRHQIHENKISPVCLARNAEHRGDITLGGTLDVSNWVEREHEGAFRVRANVMIARNVNIPIRRFARAQDKSQQHIEITEWWDWTDRVAHDAFILPDECHRATDSGATFTFSAALDKFYGNMDKRANIHV